MNYLNINQVLVIHNEVIDQIGGTKGIRDLGLVESAVARPQATFGGKDLYPDIFSKAASLEHSLIRNHPFVDGNKRTGETQPKDKITNKRGQNYFYEIYKRPYC